MTTPQPMNTKYKKLRNLLRELFQLDQADLDFGIYRIMNQKRDEVEGFLDRDLLPQVKKAFEKFRPADKAALQAEVAQLVSTIESAGMDPEQSPKVQELRSRLSTGVDIAALEDEVFSDLYSFFRRYYHGGDFLSLRRYKEGVYAIPYEGEEVKLHWANHDQYYIKSSEYLTGYAFKLSDGRKVRFELASASTERDNNKAAAGQERGFSLVDDCPISEEAGELVLRFAYEPHTDGKTTKQDALNKAAVAKILDEAPARWKEKDARPSGLAEPAPTDKDKERTLLAKHIRDFTAKSSFDYFIHKDLGGFLKRELDFFIKNEILHLDDIDQVEDFSRVEEKLSKIRVLRSIAHKIIRFLSQLEDFQKKLWLKKKFVVETNWCITLDRIPKEFYPEIAANDAQRQEWVRLFGIEQLRGDMFTPAYSDPLSLEFLGHHQSLSIDTRHFAPEFTRKLLIDMGGNDEGISELLVNGDNFQAMSLLQARYEGTIQCIYADPPYNTDAGPILYKNGYRSSSWVSMMDSRLGLARKLLTNCGAMCVTIDDYQVHELALLLNEHFTSERHLGTALIRNNPSGRATANGFSICHEYGFFYGNSASTRIERLPRTEKQLSRFSTENGEYVDWRNFRKDGGAVTHRRERPKQFYPIYVDSTALSLRIPNMMWNESRREWNVLEEPTATEQVIYPIDANKRERVWSLNHISAKENFNSLLAKNSDGELQIYRRHKPSDGVLPRTWWDVAKYAAREHGSAELKKLFGHSGVFTFAKSPHAVGDCIWVCGLRDAESKPIVLDFFAGSGTTAHAVINLNRKDKGDRRSILIEMGNYFDTVLLPRVKKVIFSPSWQDGMPEVNSDEGSQYRTSHLIKCIRLESYEDALDNLQLAKKSPAQQLALEASESTREDYMLGYMLDVETRGSASLLNIKQFKNPFEYTLKVTRNNETKTTNVDLVETFNYLIGLRVEHYGARVHRTASFERDEYKRLQLEGGRTQSCSEGEGWTFKVIQGRSPENERVLVIWRVLTDDPEKDNLMLDAFFQKMDFSTKDSEFDVIYVNGDNNLENLRRPNETWKVQLLEETFHRLMFDVQDV